MDPFVSVVAAVGMLAIGWFIGRRSARPPPTVPALPPPVVLKPLEERDRELSTLRAVVDGMAEGVWITAEDGTVIQHNDALKELLYAGTELVGQRAQNLVKSSELSVAVNNACREGASTQLELQIEGLRPRVLRVQVSPLGRELKGSAALFFDVTELRHLEKVRKDFVANVSHELRTPITAIRGYSETLQSGALNDPANAARMVEIIHRQSERLSELVEDLLELSRLETHQLKLQEVPVDLCACALRAADAVRPKALARNVGLSLEIPPGLTALGDERGVEQVLLNLLDNAVKYVPQGGKVRVLAREGAAGVVLAVADNGTGIEAKHLPRLFERFYRVDKGRSRDMGGTGLGLSIVKHLVTSMQGDVRVESTVGEGSTFFVEMRPAAGNATQGE